MVWEVERWSGQRGSPYCNPDWVSFTAQEGFAAPPDTLHFWPFTEPSAMVEK